MARFSALLLFLFFYSATLMAQDTLPKFTVSTTGNNKMLISWTNPYPTVTQISIQRSFDSTKNFKTILSVPDPTNSQNGFVDTKALTPLMFYRLFIVLDSGKYIFTESKRPFWDTVKKAVVPKPVPEKFNGNANKRVVVSENLSEKETIKLEQKIAEPKPEPVKPVQPVQPVIEKAPPPPPEPEKFFVIKKRDSIVTSISTKQFKPFRDSILNKTKDTLVFRNADTIVLKPFVPKEVYKPSLFVYTEKDGNIAISLSDAANKHYSVKFFDEKSNPLFEISKVKESYLTLDKVNFLKSGWYRFELYEDGKLKERNKFFIPKEF